MEIKRKTSENEFTPHELFLEILQRHLKNNWILSYEL